MYLDILSKKLLKKKKFDTLIVNNIEYLFNNRKLNRCLKNIKKITNYKTDIFIIFRSNDGFIINLIDNYLLPLETKLVEFLKRVLGKKIYFSKNFHGF